MKSLWSPIRTEQANSQEAMISKTSPEGLAPLRKCQDATVDDSSMRGMNGSCGFVIVILSLDQRLLAFEMMRKRFESKPGKTQDGPLLSLGELVYCLMTIMKTSHLIPPHEARLSEADVNWLENEAIGS